MQSEVTMASRELVAASARPIILAVLSKGENYGYAIIQMVKELSGGQLAWSEGMLYPALHRLEQEKVILSSWKKSENGRRRKYYRLSANGTRAKETEKNEWLAVHRTLVNLWGPETCTT